MNIKKLEELDKKQFIKLEALKSEHAKLKAECETMKADLPQVLIDKGQDEADKVAAELNKTTLLLEAQEMAIKKLEATGSIYYSDADVINGFKDYSSDYNKQFDKLHNAYLKCLDDAFSYYKKMVELRKDASSLKESYKLHLIDKGLIDRSAPLSTLELNSRLSKDSVPNFTIYYGEPTTLDAMQKTREDMSVFSY